MASFNDDELDFGIGVNELTGILSEKRKYNLKWKWLHDQLLFWREQFNDSEIFQSIEVDALVPKLVPYLCIIFDEHHDVENKEKFISLIQKDNAWRWTLFKELTWDCLLVPKEEEMQEGEYQEMGVECKEEESDLERGSEISIMSLGLSNPYDYKMFVIKMRYLLNLLFPSNFQYTAFKFFFGPDKEFKLKEYISSYPFYFPKEYYPKVMIEKEGKKGKGAARYSQTSIDPYVTHTAILALNMANEAEDVILQNTELLQLLT